MFENVLDYIMTLIEEYRLVPDSILTNDELKEKYYSIHYLEFLINSIPNYDIDSYVDILIIKIEMINRKMKKCSKTEINLYFLKILYKISNFIREYC